jgi:hypothetical protein
MKARMRSYWEKKKLRVNSLKTSSISAVTTHRSSNFAHFCLSRSHDIRLEGTLPTESIKTTKSTTKRGKKIKEEVQSSFSSEDNLHATTRL